MKIIVSSDLDEYRIAELVTSGAPIDGFGVGTELITSRDAPALSMVYKLVELDGQGKFKLSPGKKTYPMAKQVFRRRDRSDRFCGDHVTRADESAEGEPLLVPILQAGRQVGDAAFARTSIRSHCRDQLASLPERLLSSGRKTRLSDHLQRNLEADAGGCSSVSWRATELYFAGPAKIRSNPPEAITWPRSSAWPIRRGGGQDHHGHQPRGGLGQVGPNGPGRRRRSAVQCDQRPGSRAGCAASLGRRASAG